MLVYKSYLNIRRVTIYPAPLYRNTKMQQYVSWIVITRNKLDMSCNAMKHILVVFFSLHRG